jgi:hypothetical protein
MWSTRPNLRAMVVDSALPTDAPRYTAGSSKRSLDAETLDLTISVGTIVTKPENFQPQSQQ